MIEWERGFTVLTCEAQSVMIHVTLVRVVTVNPRVSGHKINVSAGHYSPHKDQYFGCSWVLKCPDIV
jgi:hypothetical protein